ncbi:MAG: tetratricopeptide repeat protein [Polyangiaceae bacterium]|nr:tetratricopeptide repeat protein [Polyangiaceae bacterium]
MVTKAETAAEDFLRKAMCAKTARSRAAYARRGLSSHAPLDRTTHTMLLRQLYLSLFEERRFGEAHTVALHAIELDVLADVLHQDAARSALASGDLEGALAHLRAAARRGPASRRSFHLWTLGSTLFLAARYDEAVAALACATRWGTTDKPLYRAHLALVRIASGDNVDDLQETINALAKAPCGKGYGRFLLGHLAYAAREWGAARRYLEAFLERTSASRPALGIALEGEVRMTLATLAKISALTHT